MIRNRIVEEVWEVRRRLIKEHGGPKAYFEYLLKLDQERLRREASAKKRKRAASSAVSSAKGKKKSTSVTPGKRTTKRKAS